MKNYIVVLVLMPCISVPLVAQQDEGIRSMLSVSVGTETGVAYELALSGRNSLRLSAGAKVPIKNSAYTFAEDGARGVMPYAQLEWRYYMSEGYKRSELNGGFYMGLQCTLLDLEHKLFYRKSVASYDVTALTFGPKVGWQERISTRLYGWASFTLALGQAFRQGWTVAPTDKGGLETAFEFGLSYRL